MNFHLNRDGPSVKIEFSAVNFGRITKSHRTVDVSKFPTKFEWQVPMFGRVAGKLGFERSGAG